MKSPQPTSRKSKNTPLCYSYVRFSSRRQEKGDSVRRQTEMAEKWASEHQLQIDDNLRMEDLGVSAWKGKNTQGDNALGGFLQAIKSGLVDRGSYLLVESLDRISRQKVTTALRQFQEITDAGIRIITTSDGQEYSTDKINDNWTSLIIALGVMARANEESERKSQRVRAKQQANWDKATKTKQAITRNCPAWLTLSDDRKSWIVNKERSSIVKTIFKLANDGLGHQLIAKELNNNMVESFNNTGWTTSIIGFIIRNEAVIGTFSPKRDRTT